MLELVIGLVVAVVIWNLREAFYQKSAVWKGTVEMSAKEDRLDMQDDIKDLHDRISEKRKENGDKWFKIADLDDLMK